MKPSHNPDAQPVHADVYRPLLESWIRSASGHLHTPPDHPEFLVYGSGFNEWGVQTHQKAFAVFAVLSAEPDLDEERMGMTRGQLLDGARRMLLFNLESHHTGGAACLDGTRWGHTWISALGIERMMHGVDAIWHHLDATETERLKRVLVSECDWILDGYQRRGGDTPGEIYASLQGHHNDPESNIWNGILLHRTAMMFPEVPRAGEYQEKGTRFLVNGISIESDADDDTLLAGSPVKDWHVGANFFPTYALNHHNYLNVGYMVICLSNLAMAHFAWRTRGLTPPPALYHHAEDLWKVVKRMVFADGRLMRIGGDSRARYCYCQDYAVPTWLFILDAFGDRDVLGIEAGWLDILKTEIRAGDGNSFLSARLAPLAGLSPTYYTRLESDRAVSLSMALLWRRQHAEFIDATGDGEVSPPEGVWTDEYHGAALVRGPRRLSSWTWCAAEPPQGNCLPTNRSDLAEWRWNLTGRIEGTGRENRLQVVTRHVDPIDDGFLTGGMVELNTGMQLAEGERDRAVARQHLLFAALPDDATTVCIQVATSIHRSFIRTVKGLFYQVPNDVFNHGTRTYHTASGSITLDGPSQVTEQLDLASRWVNVDGVMGIQLIGEGADSLVINRTQGRQIGFRDKPQATSLYVDELCAPCILETCSHDADAVILDVAFLIHAGVDAEETRQLAGTAPGQILQGDGYRGAVVSDINGTPYVAILNLLPEDRTLDLEADGLKGHSLLNLVTGASSPVNPEGCRISVPAYGAALYKVE